MEFETDGVASRRIVGQKLNAAAASQCEIQASADLIRSKRAAVVGNFLAENEQTGGSGQKRLNFIAAAKVRLKANRRDTDCISGFAVAVNGKGRRRRAKLALDAIVDDSKRNRVKLIFDGDVFGRGDAA